MNLDQIKQVWIDDTGEVDQIEELWSAILDMTDSDPVAIIDRIQEIGGYDDALEPTADALDEMVSLVTDDDQDTADDEQEQFAVGEEPEDHGGKAGETIGDEIKKRLNKIFSKKA